MKLVKVSPHCWMFQGSGSDAQHSYGSTIGVILGNNANVSIDSGFHNDTARQVLGFIQRKTESDSNRFIVNTHYHSDHTFGNNFLARNHGLVIAQENTRLEMSKQSEKLLRSYKSRGPEMSKMLRGVKIHLPEVTFSKETTLYDDDNSKIELVHPDYRAHTDGDTIVHVRNDHVVYAGDILWTNYHANMQDGDFEGMVKALKMILRLRPRRIVPGHGPVSRTIEVRRFIKYFLELDRNSRKAIRKGLNGRELYQASIPAWSWNWSMRWVIESYLDNLTMKS